MGDGSLAFAPQWLKAGHTSLRSGTQGGTSSSKEESSKGVPWRESGSRLGLGAGADRESTDLKFSNQSRRQTNPYQDRLGPQHTRGGERSLTSRTPNQSRVLSDRELVEQTSSLKLRSGRSLDSKYADEKFASHKETFTPRGTSTGSVSSWSTVGPHRNENGKAHDQDVGLLSRPQPTQPHLSPTSTLLSPRQELKSPSASLPALYTSPVDQPWNTRLADTPNDVPPPVQSIPVVESLAIVSPRDTGPTPFPSSGSTSATAPDSAVRTTPRMADAIAQAQANAAQELEAARSEKARKEQLALRQSKQLVPVLASGKPKQAHLSTHGSSGTALLRRTPGVETPKSGAAAFLSSTKKDEDGSGVSKMTLKIAPKLASVETPAVQTPLKPLTKRPSKEKDRLSFFSSLKGKSSSTDTRPDSEASSQLSQENSHGSRSIAQQIEARPADLENDIKTRDVQTEIGLNGSGLNGHAKSAEPELLAEEVAFMKSLGWDGDLEGDDAEGGLTEEEIAAFHANKTRLTSPVSIPAKGAGPLNTTAVNILCQRQSEANRIQAHSFSSEMQFSDSDTE